THKARYGDHPEVPSPDHAHLLADQCGVVTRNQLRHCGVSRGTERAELDGGRWQSMNDAVICAHNGPLTSEQAQWAAVLSAQGIVALCALTAIERLGVCGFETADVHVLIVRGARVLNVPGVKIVVHESRRFTAADVLPRLPPITTIERATIDA